MDHQQRHGRNLRSQRHLRSRHRSRASDLFHSETDQIDASRTIGENLLANDPFVPLRHLEDLSPQPLLPQVETQNSDNVFLTTILPLVCFFLVCYLGHRGGGPPGEEFHRGHLIRENAERIWAMQRRKAKRKEATPEERLAKIHSGVRTMKVVSKDFHTGHCRLGELDAQVEECSCDVHNTTIDSKQSTDTADTMPLECDDDEDVCYICLDGFDVGDTVVFSRNRSCTHVFHEECMLPWLLERRENECPSCRVPLVEEDTDEDDDENENGTQSETIVNDDKCCNICQVSKNGNENTEHICLDIESGGPTSEHQTTYFIAKGRIIAETNLSEIQKGVECGCEVENSLGCREEACCRPKPILDNRNLKRRRALSLASMPDPPVNSQSAALSVPLPLQRVSISLPIDSSSSRIRNHSSLYDHGYEPVQQENGEGNLLASNGLDEESQHETMWLDHRNRFTGLQAGFSFASTSSSEDSSDEDDIIRGIDSNHTAGTEQLSSILR